MAETPKRSRLRRFGRGILWAVLGSLLGVVVLALVALGLAFTTPGQTWIRNFAVQKANETLSGRVELGKVDLDVGGWLRLRDVKLFDPQGRLVVSADLVAAHVDALALVKHRIWLKDIELKKPEVRILARADGGSNLADALQPPHPAPQQPKQASTGTPWRIELDRLALTDGLVDRRMADSDPNALHVQDIQLGGSAIDIPGDLRAELHGAAVITSPEQTPLGFELAANGTGTTLDDRLTLKQLHVVAGHSTLDASGGIQQRVAQGKASLRLDAKLGRSLGVPLAQDLVLDAAGTWRKGEDALVDVALPEREAGAAYLHAVVSPEAKPLAYSGKLKLDHFDPGALLTVAPPGDLNGTASLQGQGTSPEEAVADLTADLGPSRIQKIRIQGVTLAGHLADEALQVPKLAVDLPGGTLRGQGTASMKSLNISLSAQVPDLYTFTSNLGVDPAYLGGATGTLHVGGTPRVPSLSVALTAPHFANPEIALDLRDASVSATIADLRDPSTVTARIRVARGTFQEQQFQAFAGNVDLGGGHFKAELESQGEASLTLRATGELPNAKHQVTLSSLDVGQGDTAWTLRGPARLDLAHGARVDKLELTSGDQRIVAQGGLDGSKLKAHLELQKVDLARLPRLAVPAKLGLRGVLDGAADIAGTKKDPRVDAHLNAKGLGAAALAKRTNQTVDLRIEGTLLHKRAKGHARASFAKQDVSLDFDAPTSTSVAGNTPLAMHLIAHDVDMASLADVLDQPPRTLAGNFDVELSVDGTLASPHGNVTASLHGVSAQRAPPLSGTARLDFDHVAKLALDISAPKGALKGTAEVDLPQDLLRHPDRAKALRTEPLRADLALDKLVLDPWRDLFGIPPDASGVLTAHLSAHGTANAPLGALHLEVHQLVYGKYKNLDATADLEADDAISLHGGLALRGHPAGRLEARLDKALAALIQDPQHFGSAPVRADIDVGPLDLVEAQGPKPTAHGTARAVAELRGTLDQPVLHAHVDGRDLAFSSAPLGSADAAVDYERGHLQANALLEHFSLKATAEQNLGLAAMRKGFDPKRIPVDVTLRADGFELASLSGITEAVSSLGGKLDADAHLWGSAGDPTFRGNLAVHDGRIVVSGFGDYQQIAMELAADNRNVKLNRCEVHSGNGWAKLTASASRATDAGPFDVTGELHSDKFPVENEDQVLAYLQADAKVDGELGGRDSLVNLRFSKVHAEVPKLSRKDVQSLSANPDIVILGRTEKSKRRSARLDRELNQAVAAATDAVPTPGPPQAGPQVRLGIFAPSDCWLKGPDINVEVRAAMGVRIRPAADQIIEIIPPPGRDEASYVEVKRGYLSVVGRRFEIDEHKPPKVTFEGGAPTNGRLDASVLYNDRADQIVVTVGITGPMTKPNPPTLTSEPPMDPSSLALLIATGHLNAKRGAGQVSATSQAGSVVGSFLAGQLQSTVAKNLPIDTVTVQTNQQGEISAEVGKYITDKIYVGYTRNFASDLTPGSLENQDQNVNEVTLQYQLSQRWQLEAVGGETQGGIDAIWQKDY